MPVVTRSIGLAVVISVVGLIFCEVSSADELIRYPKRVVVPASVPAVATVFHSKTSDVKKRVLPPVYYLTGHYEGWQDCLWAIAMGKNLNAITVRKTMGLNTAEPWSDQGYSKGWRECLVKCRAIDKRNLNQELKDVCFDSLRALGEVEDESTLDEVDKAELRGFLGGASRESTSSIEKGREVVSGTED